MSSIIASTASESSLFFSFGCVLTGYSRVCRVRSAHAFRVTKYKRVNNKEGLDSLPCEARRLRKDQE